MCTEATAVMTATVKDAMAENPTEYMALKFFKKPSPRNNSSDLLSPFKDWCGHNIGEPSSLNEFMHTSFTYQMNRINSPIRSEFSYGFHFYLVDTKNLYHSVLKALLQYVICVGAVESNFVLYVIKPHKTETCYGECQGFRFREDGFCLGVSSEITPIAEVIPGTDWKKCIKSMARYKELVMYHSERTIKDLHKIVSYYHNLKELSCGVVLEPYSGFSTEKSLQLIEEL